jgi:hypothetical protein
MRMFVLRKTKNGWLVTDDDGYLSPTDIENCHVFQTMESLCRFLLSEVKKNPKSGH